jgi:hypothetical protein
VVASPASWTPIRTFVPHHRNRRTGDGLGRGATDGNSELMAALFKLARYNRWSNCTDCEFQSHAIGLDRNEVGALPVAAGLDPAADHALIVGSPEVAQARMAAVSRLKWRWPISV